MTSSTFSSVPVRRPASAALIEAHFDSPSVVQPRIEPLFLDSVVAVVPSKKGENQGELRFATGTSNEVTVVQDYAARWGGVVWR